MRSLWIKIESTIPLEEKRRFATAAKDLCDVVMVDTDDVNLFKSVGIHVASKNGGDIRIIDDAEITADFTGHGEKLCYQIVVKDKTDEGRAVEAVNKGVEYILINCPDWKIIPLENLIAKIHGKAQILADIADLTEARLALETLEIGVDGIVLTPFDLDDLKTASKLVTNMKARINERGEVAKIQLCSATIRSWKPLGMGLRACIDTCDLMVPGEGLLVGCQSSALFLIQGEIEENPYIQSRPFRVNAGPISLYVLAPEGKTRYLSELRAGDEVLIVDREGRQRVAIVGRVKIERRPLLLVEAEVEDRLVKTIVQNAETICLLTKDGSISVADLTAGTEVLAYYKSGGRHFGVLVDEELVIER